MKEGGRFAIAELTGGLGNQLFQYAAARALCLREQRSLLFAFHLHRGDTVADILDAPDRDALLDWLRRCKLMHVDEGWAMVHAGLLPQWRIEHAHALAREVEDVLNGPGYVDMLRHMYGNQPDEWDEALEGDDRLRVIVNAMTRLRLCTPQGKMEFRHKSAPRELPQGYLPWYAIPERASAGHPIVFGHWSTLGLHAADDVVALDSGCLWGNALSALRLHDRKIYQVSCAGMRPEWAKSSSASRPDCAP